MKKIIMLMAGMIFSGNLLAMEDFAATQAKIEQAMQGAVRTDAEKARDAVERKPVQTLEFFGLRENMRVLELVPGGGWYTKLLAPVLRDNGQLYISIGTTNVAGSLLNEAGFDRVEVLPIPEGMTLGSMGEFSFGVSDLDMVVTFRNLHNMSAESRSNVNNAVFASLKSGGLYGIKDHTRRHNEPQSSANGRRLDPVLVIKEVQDAGFELVNYSDLHYSPVDALELEVGNADVTGRTDRFTLLFRKP